MSKILDLLIIFYAISNNLTIDEIYNPSKYSYRFIKLKNLKKYREALGSNLSMKNIRFNNSHIKEDEDKKKKFHTSLRKRMSYMRNESRISYNPNHKGCLNNWKLFFKNYQTG
jgi:hypothetical protein